MTSKTLKMAKLLVYRPKKQMRYQKGKKKRRKDRKKEGKKNYD